MNLVEPSLLASGLAVDSCLVALAYGLASREHRIGRALAIGATFGGFQGALLWLGWLLGAPVASRLSAWDHWIAFGVLAFVGVRTIREGYAAEGEPRPAFSTARLLVAGVATSIDAFAAGFGVSLGEQPHLPALVLTTLFAGVGSIVQRSRHRPALGAWRTLDRRTCVDRVGCKHRGRAPAIGVTLACLSRD
jgi:putative Mn2+ efflux pump MntP